MFTLAKYRRILYVHDAVLNNSCLLLNGFSNLIRQLNERMLVKDREEQEVRSNNPLRTVLTVLPEGLGGTLSKGIRWRCAHAACKPFTISNQNIRFTIPCPIEPDLKE